MASSVSDLPDHARKRSRLEDALPPWIANNLKSWNSWKIVIRCWIAMWVAFILILPNRSLAVLGNAAFFAAFILLMIPPMFPVQVNLDVTICLPIEYMLKCINKQMYFFATSTLLLGCLCGWAWGCAAMAAANRARNKTVLAAQYKQEQSSLQGKSNPDQLFQVDLFHGIFLEPASSAVFGVFFGL